MTMIPGGYGFEVLKFDENLREIYKLPEDVRIVGALPPIPLNGGGWAADLPPGWTHDLPLRPVFILISHRYCVRVSRGMAYQVTDLEEFLRRYADLDKDEREPLPTPDPHNQLERMAWHRDDDGVVRQYVWHDKGGWVPLWTR